LEESNDRLLTNVAQSLMRPLALQAQLDHPHPPLRDPEIAALWQLAESAEEKLRLRFVEEAIRTPTTTRQLRYRAAFALQAAVALDPVRRDAVERILVKDLSSEGIPLEQRTDLSLALAALAAC
jgi:hypothetical protein